jgi:hypothetical protein
MGVTLWRKTDPTNITVIYHREIIGGIAAERRVWETPAEPRNERLAALAALPGRLPGPPLESTGVSCCIRRQSGVYANRLRQSTMDDNKVLAPLSANAPARRQWAPMHWLGGLL